MTRVFISYAHIDLEFATRLATALAAKGIESWIDREGIHGGARWSTSVQEGLKTCDALVLVLSPESMASGNVEDEWQFILDEGKPVVPALLRPCELHFQLRRIQHIDFHEQLFEAALPQLADGIRRAVEGEIESEDASSTAAMADAPCPYRGLHAFREEDARFFFGREVFTQRLVNALTTKPMVGVIGPSGSGKSSVVFAGMMPELRAASGNGASNWTVLKLRPGAEPFHALAGVLVPLLETELTETARLVEVERLAGALGDGTLTVAKVLNRIRDRQSDLARILMIVDQFEELYTLCPDIKVQRGFQDLLFEVAHANNGAASVKLALTLRADFMGHATAYRPFSEAIQDHNVILGPMNPDELARTVVKPAELQGRAFESGLVERILDDVGEEAGSLPLLEFALTKLWDEQVAGWLTHEAYESIGRVEGAVARHADAVFEGLSEADQQLAHKVFVQMVLPGEGTEDTRRVARKDELGEECWSLVRRVADARLVVTNRDDAGLETAEVVHEALIRTWGRLKGWMNEDRRFRMWQERLRFALRGWEEAGQDDGALLRGVPLAEAEQWLADRGEELAGGENDFVRSGIEARDRSEAKREQRRQQELEQAEALAEAQHKRAEEQAQLAAEQAARASEQERAATALHKRALWLLGALGIAAVLAIVALVAGRQASRNAQQAERNAQRSNALALAANAQNLLASGQVEPALAAALEAVYEAGDEQLPEVELTLADAAYAPGMRRVIKADDELNALAQTADGSRALTGDSAGNVVLWDLRTGDAIWRRSVTGWVLAAAISPDGKTGITGGYGAFAITAWDLASGEPLRSYNGNTNTIWDLNYDTTGSQIVSASDDGSVRLWDAASGEQRLLIDHGAVVKRSNFTPDGARVISAGTDKAVRTWDVTDGAPLRVMTSTNGLVSMAIDEAGQLVAAGSKDVLVWGIDSGEQVARLQGHINPVNGLAFAPDSRTLYTASSDTSIRQWDVSSAIELRNLTGHSSYVQRIAIDQSGERMTSASKDGTLRSWDLSSSALIRRIDAHEGGVEALAMSPNGTTLASGGRDNTIRLWDIASGEAQHSLDGHASVWDLSFSPDGLELVSGAEDGFLRLWNVVDGEQIWSANHRTETVRTPVFSHDGRLILSAGYWNNWSISDAESGQELERIFPSGYAFETLFTPKGGVLAGLGSAGFDIQIWDPAQNVVAGLLQGHESMVQGLAMRSDGRTVVSVSSDRTLRLWDLETQTETHRADFNSEIRDLVISPDDRHALLGLADGAVLFWDLDRHAVTRRYVGHTAAVRNVAFTPDGKQAISASLDGDVRMWEIHPDMPTLLVWTLTNRYVRDLTCSERERYRTRLRCDEDGTPPASIAERLGIEPSPDMPDEPAADPQPEVPPAPDLTDTTAAPVARGELTAGETPGQVTDGAGETWRYAAQAGEIIHLRARAERPADGVFNPADQVAQELLDTVLVVRLPDGQVLAESKAIHGGYVTDAEIRDLDLVQDGTYAIEVHSYLGRTSGPYTLEIEPVPLAEPVSRLSLGYVRSRDLAWFGDGKHAVGAMSDGSLRVWDMESGSEIRHLIGHTSVLSVARSRDGKTAISSGADRQLVWWDLAKNMVTRRVSLDSVARRIRFNGDETRLLTGHNDGSVRMMDASTGDELQRFEGHTGKEYVKSIAFSPDGRYVLSGSADAVAGSPETAMLMWDVETGELIRHFDGHANSVYDVDFSPDGKRIVSGGAYASHGHVILWDAETGEEIRRLGRTSGSISRVRFVGDGAQVLALGHDDSSLRLLDVGTGEERLRSSGHATSGGLAVSPSGRVITGSNDGLVIAWDLGLAPTSVSSTSAGDIIDFDAVPEASDQADERPVVNGVSQGIMSASGRQSYFVQAAADSQLNVRVAAETAPDGAEDEEPVGGLALRATDTGTGRTLFADVPVSNEGADLEQLSIDLRRGADWRIEVLAEPATQYAMTTTQVARIQLAISMTVDELISVPRRRLGTFGMAITPDGKQVIAGLGDRSGRSNRTRDDNRIGIWDLETGKLDRWLNADGEAHTDIVSTIVVSPDKSQMISGSEAGEVVLWDLETGEVVRSLEGLAGQVWSIAITSDGARAFSATDHTAILWDLASGEVIHRLEHENKVFGSALSPNGTLGATGQAGGEIILWDLDDAEPLWTTKGHGGIVKQMAFTPDVQRLVSVSTSGDMAIWDVGTGEELRRMKLRSSAHYRLGISPDGRWALTGSNSWDFDGSKGGWLWDLEAGEVVAELAGTTDSVLEVGFASDGNKAVGTSLDGAIRVWDLSELIAATDTP